MRSDTEVVGVLDYGVGNLKSLQNAIESLGTPYFLVRTEDDFKKVKKLILPGVGAFASAMRALSEKKFINPLNSLHQNKIPILGVCLGMQILFEASEESQGVDGLAWLKGEVLRIPSKDVLGQNQKIPHMGWNDLKILKRDSSLVKGLIENEDVYFVHSYCVKLPFGSEDLVATAEYGGHALTAIVQKDHVWGCQFHPEKSGYAGMKILANFIEI